MAVLLRDNRAVDLMSGPHFFCEGCNGSDLRSIFELNRRLENDLDTTFAEEFDTEQCLFE